MIQFFPGISSVILKKNSERMCKLTENSSLAHSQNQMNEYKLH